MITKIKLILSNLKDKLSYLNATGRDKLSEALGKSKNALKSAGNGLILSAKAVGRVLGSSLKILALIGRYALAGLKRLLSLLSVVLAAVLPSALAVSAVVVVGIGLGMLTAEAYRFITRPHKFSQSPMLDQLKDKNKELMESTVMIMGQKAGGTGIILSSNDNESKILTNNHICSAIENGGTIITESKQQYLPSYFQRYNLHDLCLVTVKSNLGHETKFAAKAPEKGDYARISGHPALLPTIITDGRIADNQIITVFTGFRPCVQKDMDDPLLGLVCMIAGVVPILTTYDSTVVTATIMGGSSGSGVYNLNNELEAVVFAGSGKELSYAFTVPYGYVRDFLLSANKAHASQETEPKYSRDLSSGVQESTGATTEQIKKFMEFCQKYSHKSAFYNEACNIVQRDVNWRKGEQK